VKSMEICLFIAHIFDLFIVVMSIRVIWLCNVESSKIFFVQICAGLHRFAQICCQNMCAIISSCVDAMLAKVRGSLKESGRVNCS